MAKAQKVVLSPEEKAEAKQKRWAQIKRDKWMYLLLLPGFLYFIIFKIVPMWGILISFKDYYAGIPFFGSNFFNGWIGFDNFKNLATIEKHSNHFGNEHYILLPVADCFGTVT